MRNDGRSTHRIILYTKPDCTLCDEAKATLLALRDELSFEVQEVDITADPALDAAFREEIPVGFCNGQKLFKYRIEPGLIRRQLLRRGAWFGLTWRVGHSA